MDHLRQLQPDEHEKNSVENEDDHLPNRHSLESHPSAQDAGRAPPVIDAGNDDREDAGDVQLFPAEVGHVRSKQREHGLHRRIVQTLLHLRRQPAHGEADSDAARGDEKKLHARLPERKAPGQHGGHRETERDERSGVVHQALAFEDDNDLAGHPQILGHRQCGHGVRRRNEGAENKTDGQRQSRQGMEEIGRRYHRQQDQKDGERENRPKVCAEISPGSVDGRGIKERREKQIEDQFRIEMNRRKAGHQSESHAPDGEQNWIRNADFPGDDRKQRDSHETNQN